MNEKTIWRQFFPFILQRPPIITYGVPFAFCRTTNHHHTGKNSFNNIFYCYTAFTVLLATTRGH